MRVAHFAFGVSVFGLALAVLCLLGLASLSGQRAGGEGDFVILGQTMLCIFAYIAFAFLSLGAGVVAAIHLKGARWFLLLVVPASVLACWMLANARVVRTVDTVGPKDVPRLIRSLEKDQGDDWDESVFLLAHLGVDSAPALADALKHENRRIRLGAATALNMMAFRALAAIPALSEALEDPDPEVRAMVAEALGSVRPQHGEARVSLPGLCKALNDNEWQVRFHAAVALEHIASEDGANTVDAVPALAEALHHQDAFVSEYAAKALGEIGPAARSAAHALATAAQIGEGMSRVKAARSLWKVTGQSESAVASLADLMGDKNEYVRREAATILGEIGPPAGSAGPVLRNGLADDAEIVRRAAAEALKKIMHAAERGRDQNE